MTSTRLATAAALFVAIACFANPASADSNGAVLNFGGPLGTFKAQQAGGESAKGIRRRRMATPEPRLVRTPAFANSARQHQTVPLPERSTEVATAATDRSQTSTYLPTATVSAMAALDKPLSELAEEARSGQATRATEATEEQTCKKYVPTAGLTVTVPCGK